MQELSRERMAGLIGKEMRANGSVYWSPDELPPLNKALKALQEAGVDDEGYVLDNQMPYWLYVSSIAALAPSPVAILDPCGPVFIPKVVPQGDGRPFRFIVQECDHFTLVQFTSSRAFGKVERLSEIVPPAVNPNKGVVITTHAPPWLVATVSLAYSQSAPWVANSSREGQAVVSISNTQSREVGSMLEHRLIATAIRAVAQNGAPKRGEIWRFDVGYGEHPGIIISNDSRNATAADVLLVPMTSSAKFKHRHLRAPAAETGLDRDSYAQCSDVTRANKTELRRGCCSTVSESFMKTVTRHVRAAIGDDD